MKTYKLKRMYDDEDDDNPNGPWTYGYYEKKGSRYPASPSGYIYANDFEGAEQALRMKIARRAEIDRVVEVQIP